MASPVVIAGLSPHPPIVVPEVGRGEEEKALGTKNAMNEIGRAFALAGADTLVLVTPHGPTFSDAVCVRAQPELVGTLGRFGAKQVGVRFANDIALVHALAKEVTISPGVPFLLMDDKTLGRYGADKELDHGSVVPLHFIKEHGFRGKIVVLNVGGFGLVDHYLIGCAIERAALKLGRRIAVLASGDLSHRLLPDAPAGYNPKGKVFDAKIMEIVGDFRPLEAVFFSDDLADEAGECGLRPITVMLGTLDKYQARGEILSYEGPFGVGYGVSLLHPGERDESLSRAPGIAEWREGKMAFLRQKESFPVSLARAAVENYIRDGQIMSVPREIPGEFLKPRGAFVSIHKEGALRGCMGTTEPTQDTVALEIIANAVSACSEDPRFEPIRSAEVGLLDYSVDVLSSAEPVEGENELDPRKYGIIVEKGRKKGLLLPDLPGVDVPGQQIMIARQKAGIGPFEKGVKISRFTVTRYL